MKLNVSKTVMGLLGCAVLGLTLLLVRENEGRVAAETKLNDLKYRMDSATHDSENVVLDLRSTIHDQEVRIAELLESHRQEMTQKSSEIEDLKKQMADLSEAHDQAMRDKDGEIADLQGKSRSESERLTVALNQKSSRIKELGVQLEAASTRFSDLLKEKESLEAKNISCLGDLASARNEVKKLRRENERLETTVLALMTPKTDISTHD